MKTEVYDTNGKGLTLLEGVMLLWPHWGEDFSKRLIRTGGIQVNRSIVKDQNFILLGETNIHYHYKIGNGAHSSNDALLVII